MRRLFIAACIAVATIVIAILTTKRERREPFASASSTFDPYKPLLKETHAVLFRQADLAGVDAWAVPRGAYPRIQAPKFNARLVKSISLPPGTVLELYDRENFNGKRRMFTESVMTMGVAPLGEVRSIIFRRVGAVAYKNCGYSDFFMVMDGAATKVLPGVSSLRLDPGVKIELYTGDRFTGAMIQLTDSVNCLKRRYPEFNDKVKSYRVTNPVDNDFNGNDFAMLCPSYFRDCKTGFPYESLDNASKIRDAEENLKVSRFDCFKKCMRNDDCKAVHHDIDNQKCTLLNRSVDTATQKKQTRSASLNTVIASRFCGDDYTNMCSTLDQVTHL